MESQMHERSEGLKTQSKKVSLTARQKEYLDAYKATGSTAKTANAMGVSAHTARDALRIIAEKLGVSSISKLPSDVAVNVNAERDRTAAKLMQLLDNQEYRCSLSGLSLSPRTAELDHIKPRSKGGTDEVNNLQWLDKRINRMKGQMTQEEFIECCKKVAAWTGCRGC